MKYVVEVNGAQIDVTLDADGVRVGEDHVEAHLAEIPGSIERVLTVGDEVHRVIVRRLEGRGRYSLWIDGVRVDVEALDERTRTIRAMAGASSAPTGPAPLLAPMPGLVVRVHVSPGDAVKAGDAMVVMEAMKMENELKATAAGTVRAVHAVAGQPVEKGAILVELE